MNSKNKLAFMIAFVFYENCYVMYSFDAKCTSYRWLILDFGFEQNILRHCIWSSVRAFCNLTQLAVRIIITCGVTNQNSK